MGQAVIEAAATEPAVAVVATHDSGQDLAAAMAAASCVIDFTIHRFTCELLEAARASGTRVVMGTTGHSDEERAAIANAAQEIPIVYAPNFSVGVNTLFWLTQHAARILGNQQFDIEVTEMHHRHKIDAPSGTARRLLEILNQETHTSYEEDIIHGRYGNIGPRPVGKIGMHTLRGGDVVGDHTVVFAGEGERIELTHKASSRMTFATGAVRAAVWLAGMPAGLYDMQDVLGLK
jgi:4-hydroxy-tetrahydrodipicolinate reductase